jgi:hypothetical protein
MENGAVVDGKLNRLDDLEGKAQVLELPRLQAQEG